jgi:hypothetical protein
MTPNGTDAGTNVVSLDTVRQARRERAELAELERQWLVEDLAKVRDDWAVSRKGNPYIMINPALPIRRQAPALGRRLLAVMDRAVRWA